MGVSLTAKNRGKLKYILPDEADEMMVNGLATAIYQLDNVKKVVLDESGKHIVVLHSLDRLRRRAFENAIIALDTEISAIIVGMRSLLES